MKGAVFGLEEMNVFPEAALEAIASLIASAASHPSPADGSLSGLLELLVSVFSHPVRDSQVPVPPAGHRWKEVRHDNTVTWLASWTENIQSAIKYVMLNANSKLKVRSIRRRVQSFIQRLQ